MGEYTAYTERWLDRRYRRTTAEGVYFAHMPIYGVGHPACEPGHAVRLARAHRILQRLNRLTFSSFLDVGGGEGYLSHLVRGLFDAEVLSCDLSTEACLRATELFDVDAVAVDSARLPFPDDSFDVVACAEVAEHVEHPVELLLELVRVARRAVIFTTEELERDRGVIREHLVKRCGHPHFDRNLFHPDDLRLLLGDDVELRPQFRPQDIPADSAGAGPVGAWITRDAPRDTIDESSRGVIAVRALDAAARRTPRFNDERIVEHLLVDSTIPAAPRSRARAAAPLLSPRRFVCPFSGSMLDARDGELVTPAGRRFEVRDGVAVLRDRSFPDPTADELATALALRWPSDPERVVRALELRAELAMPDEPDRLAWDFRLPSDRRGWLPAPDLEPLGDGAQFRFRSSDGDPWFASPALGLGADRIAAVELTFAIDNPAYSVDAGSGQVFWLGEDDDGLDEERSARFAVRNDGRVHTYRVELSACPRWPRQGRIPTLRVDPVDGPCELELLAVRLVPLETAIPAPEGPRLAAPSTR